MAAVARCFPGKGAGGGGGDRVPNAIEIMNCSHHLRRELQILQPKLILAVGKLAIAQVLGPKLFGPGALLTDVVGKKFETEFYDQNLDVICIPHPSGLSSWYKVEPGKTLLRKALKLIGTHSAWGETFDN
jgi:uracil-DNA glycosylase